MKKVLLPSILILLTITLFAQTENDRRGFQGVVKAATKQSLGPGGHREESSVNVEIQFSSRSIIAEGDTYEIVKKEFDGEKTVFTCTKRRGTFEISYIPGNTIRIVDKANPSIETVYKSLSE